MQVIKHRGNILGAKLTKAEQKALDIEINKAWANHIEEHQTEYDSTILYTLMEVFGFDEEQLHRYYNAFNAKIDKLIDWYKMDHADQYWLCTQMLKNKGIDIEQWAKEYEEHKEEIDHGILEE